MSPPKDSEAPDGQGVLANLPRTRPQRTSPRRVAARHAREAPTGDDGDGERDVASAVRAGVSRTNGRAPSAAPPTRAQPKRASTAAHRTATPKRSRVSAKSTRVKPGASPPVPSQGFECEGERASGPVHPPGGAELIASAAEMIGELARAGLASGERLLRDALARLPLS